MDAQDETTTLRKMLQREQENRRQVEVLLKDFVRTAAALLSDGLQPAEIAGLELIGTDGRKLASLNFETVKKD